MRARYYDAQTSRFISKDPVWPQIDDPRQLNPYQYAANDPFQYLDPRGLKGGIAKKIVSEPMKRKIKKYLKEAGIEMAEEGVATVVEQILDTGLSIPLGPVGLVTAIFGGQSLRFERLSRLWTSTTGISARFSIIS